MSFKTGGLSSGLLYKAGITMFIMTRCNVDMQMAHEQNERHCNLYKTSCNCIP